MVGQIIVGLSASFTEHVQNEIKAIYSIEIP